MSFYKDIMYLNPGSDNLNILFYSIHKLFLYAFLLSVPLILLNLILFKMEVLSFYTFFLPDLLFIYFLPFLILLDSSLSQLLHAFHLDVYNSIISLAALTVFFIFIVVAMAPLEITKLFLSFYIAILCSIFLRLFAILIRK